MNNKYQIDIDIDDKVVIKNTNNNTQMSLDSIIKKRNTLKLVQEKLKKKFIGIDVVIQNIIQQIYG